jgi:hypothetical protein
MPRQSDNVETPDPGTENSYPDSYAKMAKSMRDNADAGDQLGAGSMERAARYDARKVPWNQRSRMGSIYDPPQKTNHVNKSYKMAGGGVVPDAGTIGAFPSAIMPQGAPLPQQEPAEKQPEQQKPKILTSGEQIEQFGSHR